MDYIRIYNQLIDKAQLETTRSKKTGYYERHHITPKSLGGSDDADNLVLLTAQEHYIAHHLLCKAYPDNVLLMYAFDNMCHIKNGKQQRNYAVSSVVYATYKEKQSKHHVYKNVITGENEIVLIEYAQQHPELYVGINRDRIGVVCCDGSIRYIKKEEFDSSKHKTLGVAVKNPDGTWPKKTCPHCKKTLVANYYYYKTHEDNCIHNPANPNYQPENPDKKLTKGKTYYINAEGEKLALTKDDPRVLSGEFWSVGKGLVTIKNIKTGQSIKVTRDDPRLKDPEWETKFKKGTFPYRNKMTGEIRLLSKDDPLRQSDQWEATNKGAHTGPRKNREYATCPYCGKVGLLQSGFTRWHMENCRHKPKC